MKWGVLIGLLALAPVQAQLPPAAAPAQVPISASPASVDHLRRAFQSAQRDTVWDGIGMASFTFLFTLVATVSAVAADIASCSQEDDFDGGCGTSAMVVLGPLVGLAAGPLLYDDLIGDGVGSLSSAYGGLAVGLAGMLVVGLATEGDGIVLAFLLPFVGAGIGYSVWGPHDARKRRLAPTINVQTERGGGRRTTAGIRLRF